MLINVILVAGTMTSSKRLLAQGSEGTEKAVEATVESLFNIKTVFALNASPHFIERFTNSLECALKSSQKLSMLESASFGIGQFIVYSTYALLFWASRYTANLEIWTCEDLWKDAMGRFGIGQYICTATHEDPGHILSG
jgi:ABC-type bacteriocin/lantibiotic exporter with double-glycine peptidase domain